MSFKPTNKLRIMVLVHQDLIPPDHLDAKTDVERQPWRTEHDVVTTLKAMGHSAYCVGLSSELAPVGAAIEEFKPQIAVNLLEEFAGQALFDQHVVSYLELMKQPYTGCNPRGLTLARDKALTKKILTYHRIPVPGFTVFPLGHAVRRTRNLKFPLFVKSVVEEGSTGISQASVVYDQEKLTERVQFIHRHTQSHAIAEQYIEGREIYVGVIGNARLHTYPAWELVIKNLPEGSLNIATGRLKWNQDYQKKVGVETRAADLPAELHKKAERLSKRIYRILGLSGYARLDFRMTPEGEFYLLEANPNPQIALHEDFADSAAHAGVTYEHLLQKIVTLGLSYDPTRYWVA